jgi:hypothetical protein
MDQTYGSNEDGLKANRPGEETLGTLQEATHGNSYYQEQKRRKTVQAREIGGVLEIPAPAHMSDKQLEPIINNLKARIGRHKKLSKLECLSSINARRSVGRS